MKLELIELLLNDEMIYKYKIDKPYDGCKKCEGGIRLETNNVCDCSKQYLLNLILGVPARYNCKIKIKDALQKVLKKDNKFIVIDGDNKYSKLLAFYIAKKMIQENDVIAKYVMTREFVYGEQKSDAVIKDIIAFNKAELLIFEDIYQNRSDVIYRGELIKRIDNNRRIIFIGKTSLINLEDEDFENIQVDSSDIEIIKE